MRPEHVCIHIHPLCKKSEQSPAITDRVDGFATPPSFLGSNMHTDLSKGCFERNSPFKRSQPGPPCLAAPSPPCCAGGRTPGEKELRVAWPVRFTDGKEDRRTMRKGISCENVSQDDCIATNLRPIMSQRRAWSF